MAPERWHERLNSCTSVGAPGPGRFQEPGRTNQSPLRRKRRGPVVAIAAASLRILLDDESVFKFSRSRPISICLKRKRRDLETERGLVATGSL